MAIMPSANSTSTTLEWTKVGSLGGRGALKAPVILGVSMGAAKYMGGYPVVVAMVKAMDRSLGITVPVVLHLDHGDYDAAKACIEAGFTSIMFDGSHFPLEENMPRRKNSSPSLTIKALDRSRSRRDWRNRRRRDRRWRSRRSERMREDRRVRHRFLSGWHRQHPRHLSGRLEGPPYRCA
jgi:hypothetical protein